MKINCNKKSSRSIFSIIWLKIINTIIFIFLFKLSLELLRRLLKRVVSMLWAHIIFIEYVNSLRIKSFWETFMIEVFMNQIMNVIEFLIQDFNNFFICWNGCMFKSRLQMWKLQIRKVHFKLSSYFFKLIPQRLIFFFIVCMCRKLFFHFIKIYLHCLSFKSQCRLNSAWQFITAYLCNKKLHLWKRQYFLIILTDSLYRKWVQHNKYFFALIIVNWFYKLSFVLLLIDMICWIFLRFLWWFVFLQLHYVINLFC